MRKNSYQEIKNTIYIEDSLNLKKKIYDEQPVKSAWESDWEEYIKTIQAMFFSMPDNKKDRLVQWSEKISNIALRNNGWKKGDEVDQQLNMLWDFVKKFRNKRVFDEIEESGV